MKHYLVFGIVFAIMLSGCSEVPKEAINRAISAQESARASEADVYARETFTAAGKLLSGMNDALAAKSFERVKQLAVDAAKAFDEAAYETKKNKDELAKGIPGLDKKVSDELQAAEELYAKNKGTLKAKKVDINELVSDLGGLKNVLTEAQTAVKGSKYMDAKIKLDGILVKLLESEELMRKALSSK